MPAVIKKDGRREPFDRGKIVDGLQKACEKRTIASQKVEELVRGIEKKIQSYGLKEVPTKTIGQMVMVELHRLDKVAYVRFASVYREFRDVEEFVAELQIPNVQNDDPNSLTFSFGASSEMHPRPSPPKARRQRRKRKRVTRDFETLPPPGPRSRVANALPLRRRVT